MKVAHFVVITPGKCGLYETTRELVKALRDSGIDSRMFDPTKDSNKLFPSGTEDRGALFCDESWATNADVLVCHSGLGEWERSTSQPIVHVAHGRPRHSFISEKTGGTPIYSYHYGQNKNPRVKAVVTFWPQHVEYHKFMFPDKPVHYVQPCVDIDRWSPGKVDYDFAGKAGKVNVVITDSWRDDIDPFVPINAFGVWARGRRDTKLHIFAKNQNDRGWAALTKRLQEDGTLGIYQGWAANLERVYRAADMVITGNEIDVRTIREATACGCPVVQFPSADISQYQQMLDSALLADRDYVRYAAVLKYNPAATAKQFSEVLTNVLH